MLYRQIDRIEAKSDIRFIANGRMAQADGDSNKAYIGHLEQLVGKPFVTDSLDLDREGLDGLKGLTG